MGGGTLRDMRPEMSKLMQPPEEGCGVQLLTVIVTSSYRERSNSCTVYTSRRHVASPHVRAKPYCRVFSFRCQGLPIFLHLTDDNSRVRTVELKEIACIIVKYAIV